MIDLLKDILATKQLASQLADDTQKTLKIADVGAGSGALGITAWLESSAAQKPHVDLLEIDPKACKIAQINVDKYTTSINVIKSDLLAASAQAYDILLCNLPYVPDSYTVNMAALQEPKLAIFGGPDGLNLYRRLFSQLEEVSKRPLYILCESLPPQHKELAKVARSHGYRLEREDDFIQVFALSR